MVTILDRLKHFTATLGISIYQFENECGITHGVANKIRKTSRPLLWEKIHRRFPALNIEWLKTGDGDMIIFNHPAISNSHNSSSSYLATCDQQLLHTLISKVEMLSDEIAKVNAQISQLLFVVENYVGITAPPYARNENTDND